MINVASCPVGLVFPICWGSRKRWCHPDFAKAFHCINHKLLPSVLVMPPYGGLKHTLLDGSVENWGPFQYAVLPRKAQLRSTLASPISERLPSCPRRISNRYLLIFAWDWSEKWNLLINPAKFNYLSIGARRIPECIFCSFFRAVLAYLLQL